jgi:hypothetical protein
MRPKFSSFLFLAPLSLVASTFAQPPVANDPHRPVDKISHDLSITPEQFVACFNNVKPAPQGQHPTAEETHANKAMLLPCLQKANPRIANRKLDEVMDRYRPGGHAAQEPDGPSGPARELSPAR